MNYSADNLREAAELLNEIFDAPLKWSDSGALHLPSAKAAELHSLVARLVEVLADNLVERAIGLALYQQNAIPLVLCDDSLMDALPGSGELSESWMLSWGDDDLRKFTGIEWAPHLPPMQPLTETDLARIFGLFLESERRLLRSAGFNQQSTSIILEHIERSAPKIKESIRLSANKRVVFEHRVSSLLNRTARIARRGADGRPVAISAKDATIVRKRVIAIATIIADTLPILTFNAWGVASVMSQIAASSVDAIMADQG